MSLKRKMLLVNIVSLDKRKKKEKKEKLKKKNRNPPWGFSRKNWSGQRKEASRRLPKIEKTPELVQEHLPGH